MMEIKENKLKGSYIAANEKELYDELVRLNYARKANDTSEINIYKTDVRDVSHMCRFYLYMLPRVEKTWNDWMAPDGFDRDQQFFIVKDDSNYYLVDMQGYDYIRYATLLVNFNPDDVTLTDDEFDLIDRGHGVTRRADQEVLEHCIANLCYDLSDDGFSKKDALIYLQALLDHKFDCVVETKKYLFNHND